MAGAVSNLVLARTLLDRGPTALERIVETRPELMEDDAEHVALSTLLMGFHSHMNQQDFLSMGRFSTFKRALTDHSRTLRERNGYAKRRSDSLATIVYNLKHLSPNRFAQIVAQTRQTALSLFGPPGEMSARVGAALRAARDARSAASTDDLMDDPEVGDAMILAERDRSHIDRALFDIATSWDDKDDTRASRAISRLVRRLGEGDKKALGYVRSLTMGYPADAGLDPLRDMRKVHGRFTKEHVEAIKTARSQLKETDSLATDIDHLLASIQRIRPDLFSE